MNNKLRTEANNDFEKDFFKLLNNAVFGKTMENVRKHKDIKLATTERRRNYLGSEPNYHTTKFFTEHMLAIEMKKSEILMNKPACLGLSILDVNKILRYELWYDYLKTKYSEKVELRYMDTDSFITHIETEDIHEDIAEDVESRFDTYEVEIMK